MTSRRAFLSTLLAAGAAPRLGWAAAGNPAYLAAAREQDGNFALHGLDAQGQSVFAVPLPARGHAGAGHPIRAEAVAFARRPGTFALVIDCVTGQVRHCISPPLGLQFNGHGCYAIGGSCLFTTEQRSDTSAGLIGVWDVNAGYTRVAEFRSGGIGPHDARLMPDGRVLAVANGGIATDPTDRRKLNVGTMRPNLSYLDLEGNILEQITLAPDLHRNSIRHLALRADGLLAFGMQWEGAEGAAPPLLGLHRRDDGPILGKAPLPDEIAMQGYAGSVAFTADGSEIVITSPRGGRVHRFSSAGQFLGAVSRADVCGLATHAEGLVMSDGLGGLLTLTGAQTRVLSQGARAWDNHIVSL